MSTKIEGPRLVNFSFRHDPVLREYVRGEIRSMLISGHSDDHIHEILGVTRKMIGQYREEFNIPSQGETGNRSKSQW